jgi:hypothetical protein
MFGGMKTLLLSHPFSDRKFLSKDGSENIALQKAKKYFQKCLVESKHYYLCVPFEISSFKRRSKKIKSHRRLD